ncbi:MAG: SusD/RagB family nutrient-binding outer membrane lipoprotein [Bacteroidales bacterium]|nr:SusD/RagB family nutrient-binding outer membrane lipoprotein [Bacteroidales bacterium]
MKKIIIIGTMCAALFTFYNCSDEDFSSKYKDPSKVTSVTIEQVFTGVLEEANEFLRLGYGRYFVHDPAFGIWAQTWGSRPDDDMYESNQMQVDGSYGRYIRVLTQYKLLKKEFDNSANQSVYQAYELCGRAVMLHVLFQTLDEFGQLPFDEVGFFPLTGEIVLPHLDDTKTLYQKVLTELDEINTELASGGNVAASTDWLNRGDMTQWRVYVNSLRLRCAIRLSGAEDYTNPDNTMAADAKRIIADILGDPGKYPVVTSTDNQIYVENNFSTSPNGWWTTLTNHDGNQNGRNWAMRCTAGEALLLRLDLNQDSLYTAAADDPRLPLIFDPVQGGTREGKYVGVNPRDDNSVVRPLISGADDDGIKQISSHNERSFRDNRRMKGYVITPSEILFYKAEAILRGIAPGDAETAFKDAVLESVKMYAVVNAESDATGESALRSDVVAGEGTQWAADWTDAKITGYAKAKWDAAVSTADKLKLVYEQFWVHNTMFNAVETFNSLRRTGIPDNLYYGYRSGSNSTKVLPNRLIIPASEHDRNPNIPNERSSVGFEPGKGNWEVIFWARDLTNSSQYRGTVKTSL